MNRLVRVLLGVLLLAVGAASSVTAQSLSPDQEVLLAEVRSSFEQRQTWGGVEQQRQLSSQWATTLQQADVLQWESTTLALDADLNQQGDELKGELIFKESFNGADQSPSARQNEFVVDTAADGSLQLSNPQSNLQGAAFSQYSLIDLNRFLRQDFSPQLLDCVTAIYDLGVTRQRQVGQVQAYDLTLDFAKCQATLNFSLERLMEQVSGASDPLALREALITQSSLIFHVEFQRSTGQWTYASLSLNLNAEVANADGSILAVAYGQVEDAFYTAITLAGE